MYRNTRFGDLMKGLPRGSFEKMVSQHQADKHSKGFRCWDQLIAMIYAQLSGCRSLRELEAGFNSQEAHHYHLGSRNIKRSTLADANAKRDSGVFEMTCKQLLNAVNRKARKELKGMLYLLDSTPIPLKGRGYDKWAEAKKSDRTQGLKAHVMIAPEANVPVYLDISNANINDITAGKEIPLESGATYVFDKGYCDYNWWYSIGQAGAYFVTRLKKNAGVNAITRIPIPESAADLILSDEIVEFKNKRPGGNRINWHHGTSLRRITVRRPDKETPMVLTTNDFERPAEEIALLYKKRWDIELFFKWLKQNLKIKQFLGQSENAVKIQIYTAIITYLLIHLYRQKQGKAHSMKLTIAALRTGLFQRPDIEHELANRRQRQRQEYQSLQSVLAI